MCGEHSLNIISFLTEVAFTGFCIGGLHVFMQRILTQTLPVY